MALTSAALPLHGGDLAAAEARWGVPPEGWLDLSTGINPWPYPLPALPAAAWARLPGAAEEEALARAAARAFRAPGPEAVLAAPGTQALIQALPRLLPPGPAAVVGPTYGEHARAWAQGGHLVAEVGDLAEAIAGGAPAVVVVNPNNPDGRIAAPDQVLAAADTLAARGGLLVVDEAFCDVTPEASVAAALRPGMVVLRSFGKFYGLAGLRLGFALGVPEVLAPLKRGLGPWAVSGPALAVGTRALADESWAEATRAHLAFAAARLDAVLERHGWRLAGGTSLFRLAEHACAAEAYDRLGRAGILVRAFADRPRLLRFGLAAGDRELVRLERALAA